MTMQSLQFVIVTIIIYAFIKIGGVQALTSNCGYRSPQPNQLIVNGSKADHWPWHAAIFHKDRRSNWAYKCGGTVIDSKFILTAAHCVSKYNTKMRKEKVSVELGRVDLDANETSSQPFEVDEIFIHPNFSRINLSNDIALIRLSNDAIFNEFVQPICLWSTDSTEITEIMGKQNTVIGWGRTESAENSRVLRQLSMPVVDIFECLESNSGNVGPMLRKTNFCAGPRNGTGICAGDGGGSMTFEQNGLHFIRGIVSSIPMQRNATTNELLCDHTHYAIFTDAAQYLDWIGIHVKSVNSVRCDNKLNGDGNGLTCVIHLHIRHSGGNRKMIFEDATNTNLTTLSINGVMEVFPDLSDNKFENLKILRLAGVKLKSVERANFAQFNKIESLDLSRNQIKEFPSEGEFSINNRKNFYSDVFEQLHDLTTIDLGHNQLETLPDGLFWYNQNLKEINLSFNNIRFLQRKVFKGLNNLTKIDLCDNQLEFLPDGLFRDNQNLEEIVLSHNKINFLHRDVFEGLHNLTKIDLSDNQLESLPDGLFRDNQNLEEIVLSHNKINFLHRDVFEGLHNLTKIDLSDNQLESLPDGLFRDNQNLEEIVLSHNKINFLHRDVFEGLHNLTKIDLSDNQLESLPDGLFRDNQNLEEIVLSHNKINFLHRDVFEGLHNLTKVDLSDNQLESLPDRLFRDDKNLKEIVLSHNKINFLHRDVFEGLHNLTKIDLSDNQLESLPDGLFRDNQNLEEIVLSHNKINFLHRDVFEGLHNLTKIDLSDNQLESLPDGLFRDNQNLEEIVLSHNKINFIHRDVFEGLHNLTKIDLSDNQLESLPDGLFRDNENLFIIKLQYNKIRRIEFNFYNLPKLSHLDLRRNVCIDEDHNKLFRDSISLSKMFKKIHDQC